MFTVIIAEKEHITAIKERNRLFFDPFLSDPQLVFCEWNKAGQSFQEAVPSLQKIVNRNQSWKAVILDLPQDGDSSDKLNPFDVTLYDRFRAIDEERKLLEKDSNEIDLSERRENDLKARWVRWFEKDKQIRIDTYSSHTNSIEADKGALDNPLCLLGTWLCFVPNSADDDRLSADRNGQIKAHKPSDIEDLRDWMQRQIVLFDEEVTNAEARLNEQDATNDGLFDNNEFACQGGKNLSLQIEELKEKRDQLRFMYNSVEENYETCVKLRMKYENLFETIGRLELQHSYDLSLAKEKIRREILETAGGISCNNGQGSIGIALPDEVYCVSTRVTEGGFFNPNLAWQNHISSDYSDFVDRNLYFDKMRFLVMDILPEGHENYRTDYLRFLSAVLVLSTNEVPSSSILPRKLYRITCENDESPFCYMTSVYLKNLDETYENVEREIEQIDEETPKDKFSTEEYEHLFERDKPVVCDWTSDFNTEELMADWRAYGLSTNCPKANEASIWSESMTKSKKGLNHLLKQPRRSIKQGVSDAQEVQAFDEKSVYRISSFQKEYIQEFTDDTEDQMINAYVPDIYGAERFYQQQEEANKEVEKVIERRMDKQTTRAFGLISIAVYLACFLPLVFNNRGDAGSLLGAGLIIGGVIGLLIITLIVTLVFLRKPLRDAVKAFNEKMSSIINEVQESLKKAQIYLTKLRTVKSGNMTLNYLNNRLDPYTKQKRIRRKHQADIKKKRADVVDMYSEFVKDDIEVSDEDIRPYKYDFGRYVEYDYPLPIIGMEPRDIPFLLRDNLVTVPVSFIVSVKVEMEEIYDERS